MMRSSSLCLRPRISSSPSLSRFRTPSDRLLRRLHVSKFAIKTHNHRLRIQANADSNNLAIQDITSEKKKESSNLQTIFNRFWKVALPYWTSEDKVQARLRLASVFALTLATTGVSVGFNFLGRDFYNALASKDQEQFTKQLLYYLGAFAGGIPIFVLRDFGKETLALRWRAWMTKNFLDRYFDNRTFYMIQSQSLIDNPDQRIVDDVSSFTGTSLSFGLTFFTAAVDLVSFSNILFGIYPPLFAVLIAYSLGGTALSVLIGKGLVSLNFMQEKKEADFRYGLVRIRENAESIAFYGGEKNEMELLLQRFKEAFENLTQLLIASRNLDFFTSGYRYLIQILPAAVVAPMYFSGKIEFGVINQSYSAFNHVLGDFSVIVYQFQAISSFSAVIDRLGEFNDILERSDSQLAGELKPKISLMMSSQTRMSLQDSQGATDLTNRRLLEISHLTLKTPQYTMTLINDLTLVVNKGEHLLIMGPSGSGKTSLLRAIAGLWSSGEGTIIFCLNNSDQSSQKQAQAVETKTNGSPRTGNYATEKSANEQVDNNVQCAESMFFLPQRPYMVLGTLRQQLLYPKWIGKEDPKSQSDDALPFSLQNQDSTNKFCDLDTVPSKEEITRVLQKVHLDHILTRYEGLDSNVDWPSVLSLGEQQRLAFARLLLARPKLALLDESTSALDEINEARLYEEVAAAGITYISVGHRTTLRKYHSKLLCLTDCAPDMHGQNWISEDIEQEEADLLESIA